MRCRRYALPLRLSTNVRSSKGRKACDGAITTTTIVGACRQRQPLVVAHGNHALLTKRKSSTVVPDYCYQTNLGCFYLRSYQHAMLTLLQRFVDKVNNGKWARKPRFIGGSTGRAKSTPAKLFEKKRKAFAASPPLTTTRPFALPPASSLIP